MILNPTYQVLNQRAKPQKPTGEPPDTALWRAQYNQRKTDDNDDAKPTTTKNTKNQALSSKINPRKQRLTTKDKPKKNPIPLGKLRTGENPK
jgi:hypothetical protein